MVERLADMPGGTLGFRVSGKLTRGEYHEMLAPVRELIDRGEPLSLLIVTDPDFSGLDAGALWEDVKAAGTIGLGHRSSWRRVAVVTDKEWMRHAMSAFGWLAPGEVSLFDPDDLAAAKAWLGGTARA